MVVSRGELGIRHGYYFALANDGQTLIEDVRSDAINFSRNYCRRKIKAKRRKVSFHRGCRAGVRAQ